MAVPATWAIFPLFGVVDGKCACNSSECTRIGKHPARQWGQFAPGQFEVLEGVGVGVRTGPEFNLLVVDTDKKPGADGEANLRALGELPRTYAVVTPSGSINRYFLWPPGIDYLKCSKGEVAIAVDIRGNGGFVVGEGSPHALGGVRTALDGTTPDDMVQAPQWLIDAILATSVKKAATSDADFAIETGDSVDPESEVGQRYVKSATQYLKKDAPLSFDGNYRAKHHISEHDSEAVFLKVCAELVKRRRLPIEKAAELVEKVYNPRLVHAGTTPWEGEQLLHKLREATKDGPIPVGIWEIDDPDAHQRFHDVFDKMTAMQKAAKLPTSIVTEEGEEPPLMRGDHVEMADRATSRFRPLVFERELHAYDPTTGIWYYRGVRQRVSEYVRSFAGTTIVPQVVDGKDPAVVKLKNSDVKGVVELVQDEATQEGFFDDAPIGLACANGFVRLSNKGELEVVPHSQDHRARIAQPFDFNPNAESKVWDAFLRSLFLGDEDAAEKALLVEEFFGGALFGLSTRFQKCIVGVGGGANGKSTLIDIIFGVFPKDSVTGLSPQELGGPKGEYYRANLRGAALNVMSEMPKKTLVDTSFMKAIVPGDVISARDPGGRAFRYKPTCGHFFACNELPRVDDQTQGFWRKFIVLTFNRKFEEEGDRIVDLAKKVVEADRAGILARLAAGAARLLKQGGYTTVSSHKASLAAWEEESDAVRLFVDERCIRLPVDSPMKERISGQELYAAFTAWCEANGEKPLCNRDFAKRMAMLGLPYHKTKVKNVYQVRLAQSGPAFGAGAN